MQRLTWMVVWVLGIGIAAADVAHAGSLKSTLRNASRGVGIAPTSAFNEFADAIADTVARNLPVLSASAGFTYRYNPDLEIFERTSDTLGPLFLERPDTIGRSKLNFNASFSYVQFDEYDGDDLRSLSNSRKILLSGGGAADLEYRIGLQNYMVGLSATYGVLDNLDVNILLPLIQTTFDVGVGILNGAQGHSSDDAFGVGDILVRAKYGLPDMGQFASAFGLVLRLPSGDQDDFQGTGSFEFSPSLYVSTLLWDRVHPHLNLALDLRPDEISQSQGRYGIGVDVDIVSRVGAAIAFLGRSEFEGSADFSDTSFLHQGGQFSRLLGVNFDRKDYFDFSFGMRAVLWREIQFFANGIVAMNDDGLRNNTVIPTVGLEGTF